MAGSEAKGSCSSSTASSLPTPSTDSWEFQAGEVTWEKVSDPFFPTMQWSFRFRVDGDRWELTVKLFGAKRWAMRGVRARLSVVYANEEQIVAHFPNASEEVTLAPGQEQSWGGTI